MQTEKQTITIHSLLWYFTIFSIIGLGIETLFCYITTGVIESRKGLIWGPFCPVYGIGAAILILILNPYKDNYLKLFVYGSVGGNIIEYILSYLLEAIYGTRFWDYAYIAGNLNGRICIKYSLFWGILAIILIKLVKPYCDKWIYKIPNKSRNIINSIVFSFFIIDTIATVWGIKVYQNRVIEQYYTKNVDKKESNIEEMLFSNSKMLKTFPNLRYIDQDGKEYYIRDMIRAND